MPGAAGAASGSRSPCRSSGAEFRHWYVGTISGRVVGGDANRPDDPQYIVRLIAQVITVSLETVRVVKNLPPLQTALVFIVKK